MFVAHALGTTHSVLKDENSSLDFYIFLFSFFSAHIHVIINVMKSTGLKRSFLGTEQRGKPSLLLDWATVEPIGTLKEVVTNPNKLRPFVCQR